MPHKLDQDRTIVRGATLKISEQHRDSHRHRASVRHRDTIRVVIHRACRGSASGGHRVDSHLARDPNSASESESATWQRYRSHMTAVNASLGAVHAHCMCACQWPRTASMTCQCRRRCRRSIPGCRGGVCVAGCKPGGVRGKVAAAENNGAQRDGIHGDALNHHLPVQTTRQRMQYNLNAIVAT